MGKRFVIEAEKNQNILVGIAFSATDTNLTIYVFALKKGLKEKLEAWKNGEAELPKADETITRTIADQNLLPEDIKVKDVGKVRFIENEWAESLIQTRLLQSFDSELEILQEAVAHLDDYSENTYQECSDFWKKLLDFKKENKWLDNTKLDHYKKHLDILFEALKSLRKDHRKELDGASIVNKEKLSKQLDEVEKNMSENAHAGSIINQLKAIRAEYVKSPMRHNHRDEIDKRINDLFEKASNIKKTVHNANADKRTNDLEGIIAKMNKVLDFKIKDLQKEESNLKAAQHQFQEKLISTKIEMIKKDIQEIELKISDIKTTLKKVKKD